MDRFENNIMDQLNTISEEDMNQFLNHTDPAEFECSPELKSEIEDIVMSKTNLKNTNKNKRVVMFGKIAACAAIAVSISVAGTNDSVKASLAKLFAFAPKQGVTEVAPDDTMYKLNMEDTKVSSADLDLNLLSAYTLNDKLTVEYKAVLKGTNCAEIKGILDQGADQNQLTLDYIVEKGYGKYFDFEGVDASNLTNIYKKPVSSVNVNNKEYKGHITNIAYDTEAAMDFTVEITEEYDVPKDIYKNIENASFTLGDLTTAFTLSESKLQETATAAEENGYIVEQDNIKLRLEPTWTSDYLYIDTYVLSCGDFNYLTSYEHPFVWSNESKEEVYWLNDYSGICLMADGTMIEPEGESASEDADNHDIFRVRYKFPLEGFENASDYTIKINGVMGIMGDEKLSIPFDVEDFDKVYDIYSAHLSNVHAYHSNEDPDMPDFPMCDYDITQDRSDLVFAGFDKEEPEGDNMVLSDAYYVKSFAAEIPLERK